VEWRVNSLEEAAGTGHVLFAISRRRAQQRIDAGCLQCATCGTVDFLSMMREVMWYVLYSNATSR
jgi:hypothetical protein